MIDKFDRTESLLAKAVQLIPMGAQSFAKSYIRYPAGVTPLFAERANGSFLYDVDGNEYIDVVNSLGAIILGYGDPDVKRAIQNQLEKGTIFSLSHELEIKLSEKIIDIIPSAEMVQFGKNGSDATSAAIRLARAYTGKDEIAVCGYHSWHDWFIGSTPKGKGVPECVQDQTHTFYYNDINSLEKIFDERRGKIAAVILEPMHSQYPKDNFLENVRELCDINETLLIFDEMITGFRLSLGGAQELFNITPDLTTFGKAIANGMPLSVLCGRADIMILLEEVFCSFTHAGELLSIASGLATIEKLQSQKVPNILAKRGEVLIKGIQDAIDERNLNHRFNTSGHPAWSFLNTTCSSLDENDLVRSLLAQETVSRGLLCRGSHSLSLTHDELIIDRIIKIYESVFDLFYECEKNPNNMKKFLRTDPIKTLFTIRKN